MSAGKAGKIFGALIVALIVSGFVELVYFFYIWWNKVTNTGRTEFFYTTISNVGHVLAFGFGALAFLKGVSIDDKNKPNRSSGEKQ